MNIREMIDRLHRAGYTIASVIDRVRAEHQPVFLSRVGVGSPR